MKLRLRGEVRADLAWDAARVPIPGEKLWYRGQWYRVANSLWAVVEDGPGYDVALVVASCPPPSDGELNGPDAPPEASDA